MVNQRGYHVLIETLALKIFDEKRNETNPKRKLEFYVTDQEAAFNSLTEKSAREFVARMKGIREAAEAKYPKILGDDQIAWNNPNHIRLSRLSLRSISGLLIRPLRKERPVSARLLQFCQLV